MTTTYIVRNLPMGIPVQFRIAAYNQGGWGKHSEPSSMVTPGEASKLYIPSDVRWRRLSQGGVLSVLDHLKRYGNNRFEQLRGLTRLLAYAQRVHNAYAT